MNYRTIDDYKHQHAAKQKALRVANWFNMFYKKHGYAPPSLQALQRFGAEESRSEGWWLRYFHLAQEAGYVTPGPIRKARPATAEFVEKARPAFKTSIDLPVNERTVKVTMVTGSPLAVAEVIGALGFTNVTVYVAEDET